MLFVSLKMVRFKRSGVSANANVGTSQLRVPFFKAIKEELVILRFVEEKEKQTISTSLPFLVILFLPLRLPFGRAAQCCRVSKMPKHTRRVSFVYVGKMFIMSRDRETYGS